MRPLSEALTVLIATAEDIMRRPAHLPTALPAAFADLAAEIHKAHAQPAESIRTTFAAVGMCNAIEAFFANAKHDHHWQMVVGATLPLLKIDAYQAFVNEREIAQPEGYRR